MSGRKTQGPVIQERDRHLLRELDKLRVIDREQAKVLAPFGSTTRANARLLRLTRAGLLRRIFVGTIAGGRKAVYTLSKNGAALIDSNRPGLTLRTGPSVAGNLYLEHQLQINEIYLLLKYRRLPVPLTLRRWICFIEPLAPHIRLIPDGYFELSRAGTIFPMFLEVDMATETLATFRGKCEIYLNIAISGQFQKMLGQSQFRVLVVASSEERLENLRRTVRKVTSKIFWFSTFEPIHKQGFFTDIWQRPDSVEKQGLF